MMPGKVWAHCMALAMSAVACGTTRASAPQNAAPTVVVNLEGTTRSSRSPEARLPARGAATAPVTVVALLDFADAESAAVYQAVRRLQDRLGERDLRFVLVTPGAPDGGDSVEVMAGTLQHDHGDAAYFDFATHLFDSSVVPFGDALRLALAVGVAHGRKQQGSPKVEPDSSQPIVRAEADALVEAPDGVVPALSVNGIRVFGRLPPKELEALVLKEHSAARALGRTGVAVRAIYPERVASNAGRVVRRQADTSAPASALDEADAPQLEAPPAPAPADPERVTASHIMFSYQGALRAPPHITRSKDEAKALAQEVLGRLRRGALRFEEAVVKFSDEPGAAARKGALGAFPRQAMVKPFGDAAFALEPGELSEVVETVFGFHIIWREQ